MYGIFLKDAAQRQGRGRTAVGVWLDFYVRGNSSAVINRASVFGLEGLLEGIRNGTYAAIRVAVGIVHNLDAAATWSVIFRNCKFEFSVVAYRAETLHKAFTVCTCSDDQGAVQILECSGNYL